MQGCLSLIELVVASMGSAISTAAAAVCSTIRAAAAWKEHWLNNLRLLSVDPYGSWKEEFDRKYQHIIVRSSDSGTFEEQIAYIALPYVHCALRHYNDNNPGAEFDLVKPLVSDHIGFRGEIWYHMNFLARRRDAPPDTPPQHFFAELHYAFTQTPIVQTCIILEKPLSAFQRNCAFCNSTFGILHPSKKEFVCGKKGQRKEFYKTRKRIIVADS